MSFTESTIEVEQEELPQKKLSEYIKKSVDDLHGDLKYRRFPGGFSNLTYLITDQNQKQIILRKPPKGIKIASAHDMSREFHVLSALHKHGVSVPEPILLAENHGFFDEAFFLMKPVTGTILRNKLPKSFDPEKHSFKDLSEAFVHSFVQIHSVPWQKSDKLTKIAKPEGYIARQVRGWSQRYRKAETSTVDGASELMHWLDEHKPNETAPSLIHNDYKYDNLILNPQNWSEIRAILDWEMATIGDPLMDLGTSLGYWVEKNDLPALKMFGLTHINGNYTREELLGRYEDLKGIKIENSLFYFVFGMFKIAVIVEQIYARFISGKSRDKRFADLHLVTQASVQSAIRALEKGEISSLWN